MFYQMKFQFNIGKRKRDKFKLIQIFLEFDVEYYFDKFPAH